MWYCKPNDVPHRDYLLALADSGSVFERGCLQIHHSQIQAYYTCLLGANASDMPKVVPRLKAKEYLAILGKTARKPSGAVTVAIEDDTGAHMLMRCSHDLVKWSPTLVDGSHAFMLTCVS